MDTNNLILFDGVCNLCDGFVQFVIRHDKNKVYTFGSLQSAKAQVILSQHKVEANLSSVILVNNGRVYTESGAALNIIKKLNFPISLLYVFIIIPPFIRNFVYKLIAKNRYKMFGKKDSCMIPTPELKSRFIN